MLTKDSSNINISVPELEKERIGMISTSSNFKSTEKLIFKVGEELIEKQLKHPLLDFRVPAGEYEITVEDTALGTSQKFNYTVEENKKHLIEHPSQQAEAAQGETI